jgi:hypothetical protein
MNLKEQAFYSLEVLNADNRLERDFKALFPNNTLGQLWDALKGDLLSEEHQQKLVRIVPPVFEINGKLFLYGEKKGEYDFVGDIMDYQPVIELYDMSEEMKTGDSYTFYVSCVDYFKLAEPKDAVDVKLFLNSLK